MNLIINNPLYRVQNYVEMRTGVVPRIADMQYRRRAMKLGIKQRTFNINTKRILKDRVTVYGC